MIDWLRRIFHRSLGETHENAEPCDPHCEILIESNLVKQRLEDFTQHRRRDVARTRLEQMQIRQRIKTGNIMDDDVFGGIVAARQKGKQ